MKKLKKLSIFSLAILFLITFSACGPSKPDNKKETTTQTVETTAKATTETITEPIKNPLSNPARIDFPAGSLSLDPSWKYANLSAINTGSAVLYKAEKNRKNLVIGINPGHGTIGGESAQTYSHPDGSPKTTGGTNASGAVMSYAISSGTVLNCGYSEALANLMIAKELKNILLENGYDVLMLRDGDDVQLDNVARTVICNNAADCHIAIHFDSDGLDYDKGCFYISTPDAIKGMEPVSYTWEKSDQFGKCLLNGLQNAGVTINGNGTMDIDLTQTSYSLVPSIDIELGNKNSPIDDSSVNKYAIGLYNGINQYFS